MSNVTIINGKELADTLLERQKVYLTNSDSLRRPKLVVITIGNDDASKVYLRNKEKACIKCDIEFEHKRFTDDTQVKTVMDYIQKLNVDARVDGIIVQQPVPNKFKGLEQFIIDTKDVDGFTTYNLGGTLNNMKHVPACTPNGIMELLHYSNIDVSGKHVVILGRSNIVGKPLIGMLLAQNATVTSCNSYTTDIQSITKTADVIISAIGKPKYINCDFISRKCTCIIDVGMNRDDNDKLCGDVNFNEITAYWNCIEDDVERFITPVPGGVGPMTVYSLIKNVNIAYCENVINVVCGGNV